MGTLGKQMCLLLFGNIYKDIAYAILKQIKWQFMPISQSKENLIMKVSVLSSG